MIGTCDMFVCPSVHLSLFLSVCLSVCPSVCLSIYLSVHSCTYTCIHCMSSHPSIVHPLCVSAIVYLSVCPWNVSLSIYQFIYPVHYMYLHVLANSPVSALEYLINGCAITLSLSPSSLCTCICQFSTLPAYVREGRRMIAGYWRRNSRAIVTG